MKNCGTRCIWGGLDNKENCPHIPYCGAWTKQDGEDGTEQGAIFTGQNGHKIKIEMETVNITETMTKKCTHCGQELPLSAFGKNNKAKDGLQYWCKDCINGYFREKRGNKQTDTRGKAGEVSEQAAPDTMSQIPEEVSIPEDSVAFEIEKPKKGLSEYSNAELVHEVIDRGLLKKKWELDFDEL